MRKFKTNIVVCFEPDEAGWVRATLPHMPSVAAAGTSREDALEMAIDALMQMLAVDPEQTAGAQYERVRLEVSAGRAAKRGPSGGRPQSPAPSTSAST